MHEWHRILRKALRYGDRRPDRTGVGTLSLFGEQMLFHLGEGFPAVTTKKLAFEQVKAELACFVQGYRSLEEFHSMGCRIWDGNGGASYWAPRKEFEGDLGRIYGVQWRNWRAQSADGAVRSTDQLRSLVDGMLADPFGRRHLVTAWNPGELSQMCLPPCHVMFQCYLSSDLASLDILVYMRSVDLFLGLPFDVASYALLAHLLCAELGRRREGPPYPTPRYMTFHLGDAHVYLNHVDQAETVVDREPFELPLLSLRDNPSLPPLFGFHPDDASLSGYAHHPAVPAPLNV